MSNFSLVAVWMDLMVLRGPDVAGTLQLWRYRAPTTTPNFQYFSHIEWTAALTGIRAVQIVMASYSAPAVRLRVPGQLLPEVGRSD